MEFLLKAIVSPSLSFVQIMIISYIGALFGEMQKEADSEKALILSKFITSWMSSGFGGFITGILLQGTIAQNNHYVVLGGAGAIGYAGHKYSLGLILKLLSNYIFSKLPFNETNSSNINTKDNKDKK